MCLESLKSTSKKLKYGYKIMLRQLPKRVPGNIVYESEIISQFRSGYLKDRWYSREGRRYLEASGLLPEGGRPVYETGFHVFHTLEGARHWFNYSPEGHAVIVKVAVKNVLATGLQRDYLCSTVEQMKIIKEID